MHRGSSKGVGPIHPAPETLPLSASAALVHVEFRVRRSGREETRPVDVRRGTTVRRALHAAGLPPEGCAVLEGTQPWPLDRPLERAVALTVVPTFSGG